MKPLKNRDVFEFETITCWTEGPELLVTVSKDVERTIENFQPIVPLLRKLSQNGEKKICILSDLSLVKPSSKELREYINKEYGRYVKAVAVFSTTQIGKAMGFIYETLHGESFSVKAVDNEQEAREWLQTYLSTNPSVQHPAKIDTESDTLNPSA